MLNQNIFSYLSSIPSILQTATPSEQSLVQQGQIPTESRGSSTVVGTTPAGQITPPTNGQQPPGGTSSSEKLITSFHLLLNPEIIGIVDETNYTITLNVPYGTDVKNLTPSMVISPGATVLPASNLPQDFTTPITYKVTAQDGSIQNYGARVIVNNPPVVSKKSNQSGFIALIIIALVGIVAVITVTILFIRKKRGPKGYPPKIQP